MYQVYGALQYSGVPSTVQWGTMVVRNSVNTSYQRLLKKLPVVTSLLPKATKEVTGSYQLAMVIASSCSTI
jgi:hypothetical protein